MHFNPEAVKAIQARRTQVEKQVAMFGGSSADQRLLASLDEQLARASEPPVANGFTRLYRGEGVSNVKLPDWAKTNAGQWFTTKRNKAVEFQDARSGRLLYVDMPSTSMSQYLAPDGNSPDEYLLPQVVQKNLGVRQVPGNTASID